MNATDQFFIGITEELAEEFCRQRIEYLVGDSDEGYIPTHNVRLIGRLDPEQQSSSPPPGLDSVVIGQLTQG